MALSIAIVPPCDILTRHGSTNMALRWRVVTWAVGGAGIRMAVPTEALAGDDREALALGNCGVGREIGLGGLGLAVDVEQQRQRRGGLCRAGRDVDEVGALERCVASRLWREPRERGVSESKITEHGHGLKVNETPVAKGAVDCRSRAADAAGRFGVIAAGAQSGTCWFRGETNEVYESGSVLKPFESVTLSSRLTVRPVGTPRPPWEAHPGDGETPVQEETRWSSIATAASAAVIIWQWSISFWT